MIPAYCKLVLKSLHLQYKNKNKELSGKLSPLAVPKKTDALSLCDINEPLAH